jgi:hypothetical protein
MAKRLVCVASGYGYGPVSKLLAVAKRLKALGYALCFVGRGPAWELARHFPFDEMLVWEETGDHGSIEQELGLSNGIVNVMEPKFGVLAQRTPLPHFYIDSLFWMWSRLHTWTAKADIYFVQNFPGVQAKMNQWRANIRNPQLVGPIVDVPDDWQGQDKSATLVVSFGGLESGSLKADQELVYPHILTSLLLPILNEADFRYESIVFTGNEGVMSYLDRQFYTRPDRVQFAHLSHHSFVSLLRSARCILSSPGLTTAYEAFLLRIPVRFLPPQNYSQTLMLDHYIKTGLSDLTLHWRDLYPEYNVDHGLEVSAAVRTISSTINGFAKDLEAQERATEILRRVINEPLAPTHCLRQAAFAKLMGPPSPAIIAGSIDTYLG